MYMYMLYKEMDVTKCKVRRRRHWAPHRKARSVAFRRRRRPTSDVSSRQHRSNSSRVTGVHASPPLNRRYRDAAVSNPNFLFWLQLPQYSQLILR